MKLFYSIVISITIGPFLYCMDADNSLYVAVSNKDRAMVKTLIDEEPSLINKQNKYGLALTRAVVPISGSVIDCKIVELLLNRGANPFLKNDKSVCVIDAFKGKHTIEILKNIELHSLEIGAVNGEQALYLLQNYPALLKQARQSPSKQLLETALRYGYSTIVETMIKSGYKVNQEDLALAKRYNDKEIGRILIKALYMSSGPIAKQFYAPPLPENVKHVISAFII